MEKKKYYKANFILFVQKFTFGVIFLYKKLDFTIHSFWHSLSNFTCFFQIQQSTKGNSFVDEKLIQFQTSLLHKAFTFDVVKIAQLQN